MSPSTLHGLGRDDWRFLRRLARTRSGTPETVHATLSRPDWDRLWALMPALQGRDLGGLFDGAERDPFANALVSSLSLADLGPGDRHGRRGADRCVLPRPRLSPALREGAASVYLARAEIEGSAQRRVYTLDAIRVGGDPVVLRVLGDVEAHGGWGSELVIHILNNLKTPRRPLARAMDGWLTTGDLPLATFLLMARLRSASGLRLPAPVLDALVDRFVALANPTVVDAVPDRDAPDGPRGASVRGDALDILVGTLTRVIARSGGAGRRVERLVRDVLLERDPHEAWARSVRSGPATERLVALQDEAERLRRARTASGAPLASAGSDRLSFYGGAVTTDERDARWVCVASGVLRGLAQGWTPWETLAPAAARWTHEVPQALTVVALGVLTSALMSPIPVAPTTRAAWSRALVRGVEVLDPRGLKHITLYVPAPALQMPGWAVSRDGGADGVTGDAPADHQSAMERSNHWGAGLDAETRGALARVLGARADIMGPCLAQLDGDLLGDVLVAMREGWNLLPQSPEVWDTTVAALTERWGAGVERPSERVLVELLGHVEPAWREIGLWATRDPAPTAP